MDVTETYFDRLRKLILEVRGYAEQLPEGRERNEMIRWLGEMERICEKHENCNKKL